MYLVIRGDRLYAGYSETYTKKNGRRATRGRIAKSLGSKSELLAQDPQAPEKLKEELHRMSAPSRATERTKKLLRRSPALSDVPYAGEPALCYANYILKPIWEKNLRLKALVRYYHSKTKIEFDAEALLWQTVVNRIVSPCSHLRHYMSQNNWLGNSLTNENLRSIYRLLDFASSIRKPLLTGINKALSEAGGRDLSVVFYDVTNTWFETVWDDEQKLNMEIKSELSKLGSDASEEQRSSVIQKAVHAHSSTLRMRGPSKEGRKDPIVSIALVVDRDGIPIDFCVYKGNSSEKVTMKDSIKNLSESYGIKNTVVLADNGLNTKNNLLQLVEQKQGFLLAHSLSKAKQELVDEWLQDNGWEWNEDKTAKVKTINCSLVDEDGVVQTNYRMVIGWSEKRYKEDMNKIELREFGARDAVSRNADVSAAALGWKTYLVINKAKAQAINEKKLNKDKKLAGYYAYLFKDSREYDELWTAMDSEQKRELSAWEIISQYKSLGKIEECFRIMKTNFNLRPMYVYTDKHIEAQVLICILALIVIRILAKKLKLAGTPMTTDQIITALDGAKVAAQLSNGEQALFRPLRQTVHRPENFDPHESIRLHEVTDLSRILKCMGMKPLPPVGNKNDIAHCLKTRFDTDEQILGAKYEM